MSDYAIFYVFAGACVLGFICVALDIRNHIIWARQALDGLREQRHKREIEMIEKQIELAKATSKDVPPEEGSGGAG